MKVKEIRITQKIARKVLDTVDVGLCSGVGRPIPGQMCVEAAVCYAMGLPHGDEPDCVSSALRRLKIILNDSNWSSDAARAKGLRKLALAQLGSAKHLDDVEFAKRVALMVTNKVISKLMRQCAELIPLHEKKLIQAALKCEEAKDCAAARAASYAASYAASDAASDAASAARAASAASYAASAAASAASAAAIYAASAASYAASYAASAAASAASAAASAASAASDAASDAARAARAASDAASDNQLSFFADEVVSILIDMKAPGCRWLSLCEEPK